MDALNGHNFDENREGSFGRGMVFGSCAGCVLWILIIIAAFLLLGCQAPTRF